MPRGLSKTALNEINALSTGEAFLFLMTIVHDSGTVRVVNNNEDVLSRGNIFTAYPFAIVLNADDEDTLPVIQLSIDNVDRLLVEAVRAAQTAPIVQLELILSSFPDIVEISIPDMALRNVSYNAITMTGTLYVGDILNQRYPEGSVTPQLYGGLF